MEEQLQAIEKEFFAVSKIIKDRKDWQNCQIKFLGRKSSLKKLSQSLKTVPTEKRKELGYKIHALENVIITKLQELDFALQEKDKKKNIADEWVDVTYNTSKLTGGLHPISQVQYQLEDIFTAMGFVVLDGPHIETEFYNFEALNIPTYHPARDMQDTFFFPQNLLLRTQTSCIQIRGMQQLSPPLRIVAPGKVFRAERTDSSHESCFHQLEGMMVSENISVAHLLHFMQVMLESCFQKKIHFRIRPGYFPFVEPGFELDLRCSLCQGNGCRVCKNTGWVEMLGCGMTHPSVLNAGGIDPKKYSGFAFGIGIDRLAMMKYNITDIRLFHSGNIDFSQQFV